MSLKVKIRRDLVEFLYKVGVSGVRFHSCSKLSESIESAILLAKPIALGRLGINELNGSLKYSSSKPPFWVNYDASYVDKALNINVGVFPDSEGVYKKWSKLYLDANMACDAFSVYLNVNELYYLHRYLNPRMGICRSGIVHPMLPDVDWLSACDGKKVLLVSANKDTIVSQLPRLSDIWKNTKFSMPNARFTIIRPPFSPAVDPLNASDSWFSELEAMKAQFDTIDFDVALIAAGGYANFLAAYAKSIGKVGINMGGALDPLFGIKTKRYIGGLNAMPNSYMNEYWVEPNDHERPKNSQKIEGGCYW